MKDIDKEARSSENESELQQEPDGDYRNIDLDDYPEFTDDEADDKREVEESAEGNKSDEDFAEVGGKLKAVGPFLLGGLITLVVIIAILCVIFLFADNKKTSSSDTNGTSAGISASAQPSGNDVVVISVSANNAESTEVEAVQDSETSFESADPLDESTTEEELNVANTLTSNSPSVLNKEFLDNADYPDVISLISDYFEAYAACDLNELLSLVDYNGGTQVSQEELDERAEIVEEYQNIYCHIIEGMDTGSFVVYASYNIKFYNIDTPAPTLTRFYVVKADDGLVHIYNGEVTAKLNAYLNSVNAYDCVNELSESINKALEAACEEDETLKTLMEILYGSDES